jgi:hypothetical protein
MIDKKKAYEANRDATVSTKKANRARLVQQVINKKTISYNYLSKRDLRTRPAGLEPAAYGLEIRCSVQLSYGRIRLKTTPFFAELVESLLSQIAPIVN